MPSIACGLNQTLTWDDAHARQFFLGDGIDLWVIPVSNNLHLIDSLGHILSKEETAQAFRFRQVKDQQRFLITRIMLRSLLGGYTNIKPIDIVLAIGKNKKPFLLTDQPIKIHFNISHSEDRVLIAIAVSELGVDIERVDKAFSYQEILSQSLSTAEIDFIKNSKQPEVDFYLLWTRKESLLKATAKGIVGDLRLVPSMDGISQVASPVINSDENWDITSFKMEGDYIGAIARKQGLGDLRFYNVGNFQFPE